MDGEPRSIPDTGKNPETYPQMRALDNFKNPNYSYSDLTASLASQDYESNYFELARHCDEHAGVNGSTISFDQEQKMLLLKTMRTELVGLFKDRGYFEGVADDDPNVPGQVYGKKGKGSTSDDLVGIYFNPKMSAEVVRTFFMNLFDILDKNNIPDLSFKFFPQGFETNGMDKVVVYIDMFIEQDQQGVSTFFREIAANQALRSSLFDEGGWVSAARIPVAPKINFCERASGSWDVNGGNMLDDLYSSSLSEEEFKAKYHRYPNMPALRIRT